MSGREPLLTGRRAAPPAARALRAGPMTCVLDGIELRDVRRQGAEVANLLYVAVRDEAWNTIPAQVSDLVVREGDDDFLVTFRARHMAGGLDLGWEGTIAGRADGTIEYAMAAVAGTAFRYGRIGFNLLHSAATLAGRPYRASGAVDGPPASGTLPLGIAPQRAVGGRLTGMFPPFRHLEVDLASDRTIVIGCTGDDFEMEDQRNYADSTFKTYSTPLQRPTPHALDAGGRVEQAVRITTRGGWASQRVGPGPGPTIVRVGKPMGPIPPVGLGAASDGLPLTPIEVERIARLRPDHLWLTIDPRSDESARHALVAAADASALRTGLILELLLGPGGDGLERAASLLAGDPGLAERVRLVLVRSPSEGPIDHGPPDHVVEAARSRLSEVASRPQVGAMMGQLAALIREPRDAAPLGTVAVPICPTIHRDDDRTVMENLRGLDEQVRTALAVLDGRPVHVGPVTLASIHGPWPGGSAALGLPPQVDVRQPSLFAAAWTVGALGGLLGSGAATLTLFETVGWRGLMERAAGSGAPGRFLADPGSTFHVWHVLSDVATHVGGWVRDVSTSRPERVGAFALTSPAGTTIDVANLTREPLEVRLSLPAAGHGTAGLRVMDAAASAAGAEGGHVTTIEATAVADGPIVRLDGYAVARVVLPAWRPD